MPRSLRASIEHAAGRLGEEDAAGTARRCAGRARGLRWRLLAAALGLPDAEVAARCAALAAGAAPIRPAGEAEWPDGTATPVYAFAHDLDRAVLADLVPPAERAAAHRPDGRQAADAYGPRAGLVATELAHHFVAGRRPETRRSLPEAGRGSRVRPARVSGGDRLRARGSPAARLLDETPSRTRGQVELLSMLGQALVATEGWSSPNAEECLLEARAIADRLQDNEPRVAVLLALGTLYEVREYAMAAEMAEAGRRLTLVGDASRRLQSQEVLGVQPVPPRVLRQGAGARRGRRRPLLARGPARWRIRHVQPPWRQRGRLVLRPGGAGDLVPGPAGRRRRARLVGRSPSPRIPRGRAAALPRALSSRWCTSAGSSPSSCSSGLRHDRGRARAAMPTGSRWGGSSRAGALVRQRARARHRGELKCGLEASRITGGHMDDPYYLGLVANAYLVEGEVDAGLAAISEALELGSGSRRCSTRAELLRLRGLLLLARDPDDESAEGQLEALAVARRQARRATSSAGRRRARTRAAPARRGAHARARGAGSRALQRGLRHARSS